MLQGIHILDYFKAIWKRRITFASIIFVVVLLTVVHAFRATKIYRAEATIMPIQSTGRSANGLSGLLSEMPIFSLSGGGSDNFLIFMGSRKLASLVVESLGLLDQLAPQNEKDSFTLDQRVARAADSLSGVVKIDRDMVFRDRITIAVEGPDPEWNFKVIRQYLVELQNFVTNNALTQAKRYRMFLEEQLAQNKKELLEMSKNLANFYGRNEVSEVKAKLNIPFAVHTENGVRDFKDYGEFKRHFDVLQNQSINENDGASSKVEYVKDVPHQVYLKYLTTQQFILEQSYTTLAASYATAKLEEAKQEPSFQVLNEPVLPKYPIWPNKKRLVFGSFVISVTMALAVVFYLEFYRPSRRLAAIPKEEPEEVVEKIRWTKTLR